jgi:hypothetical protein
LKFLIVKKKNKYRRFKNKKQDNVELKEINKNKQNDNNEKISYETKIENKSENNKNISITQKKPRIIVKKLKVRN